jgi:uncharacterized protein YjbI with pentapeptide repeats
MDTPSLLEMRWKKIKQDLLKREFAGSGSGHTLYYKELVIPEIDLRTASLYRDMNRTSFSKCDLRFADVSHADARALYISDSNCCFMRFDYANIERANLGEDTNRFAGASFRSANIKEARFYMNAMLLTADFTDARNIASAHFFIDRQLSSGRKETVEIVGVGIDPESGRLRPAEIAPPADLAKKVFFKDIYEALRQDAVYMDEAIVKLVKARRAEAAAQAGTHDKTALAGHDLLSALDRALPIAQTSIAPAALPAPMPAEPAHTPHPALARFPQRMRASALPPRRHLS